MYFYVMLCYVLLCYVSYLILSFPLSCLTLPCPIIYYLILCLRCAKFCSVQYYVMSYSTQLLFYGTKGYCLGY